MDIDVLDITPKYDAASIVKRPLCSHINKHNKKIGRIPGRIRFTWKAGLYFSVQPDKLHNPDIFTTFEKIYCSFINKRKSEESKNHVNVFLFISRIHISISTNLQLLYFVSKTSHHWKITIIAKFERYHVSSPNRGPPISTTTIETKRWRLRQCASFPW